MPRTNQFFKALGVILVGAGMFIIAGTLGADEKTAGMVMSVRHLLAYVVVGVILMFAGGYSFLQGYFPPKQ